LLRSKQIDLEVSAGKNKVMFMSSYQQEGQHYNIKVSSQIF